MSKKFGVTELKEVVSELEREYDQCQTCWPTTVFSQGSFTERKVFCCSKFVKADVHEKMTSSDEESGLFASVCFVLAGFEPAYENQFIEELEGNGGVNNGCYDPSCTHVIVSNLAYDDPICAAARKDGKALVTDAWVADCLDNDALADVNSVLYRPLKDLDGIPGSEDLCICLTGYQGQSRQKIMRMVELIGARFTKPLLGNLVTHLICYKFEGEKYELARKTGLKLINHYWLEDCLESWSLLPEEDYSLSGWEVENQAKKSKINKENGKTVCTPVSPKKLKKRTSISSEVPSPHRVALTSRRDSGIFENGNPEPKSAKKYSNSNSLVSTPPSVQKGTGEQARHSISQIEGTMRPVVEQKKGSSDLTSLMEGVECNNENQGSEIFQEALMRADQRDETSPVRVRKSRRSSCGMANQVSPAGPGIREVAVAVDQCATLDCGREQMSICADSSIKRRVSVEGIEKIEVNTRQNAADFESPESKRRKSLVLSKSGLSPLGSTDRSGKEQDAPSRSPVPKQASSPNMAFASGKIRMKQKLSNDEKELQHDAAPNFGACKGVSGVDTVDGEVTELSDVVMNPCRKRLAVDSRLEAVQSDVWDAPDLVKCTADGASRHADTISSKEVSRRSIQPSSPKSPRIVGTEDNKEDADQCTHSVRKSKFTVDKDAKSASKARQSVNKSTTFVHSKEKDDVNIDRNVLNEAVPLKDGPVKNYARKVSGVTHSPSKSSGDAGSGASEQELQRKDGEAMELDVPFQSGVVKKSVKKLSKASSSRRDTSAQKVADEHNEESPVAVRKKAAPESSPVEQATIPAVQASLTRPKENLKFSKTDAGAASSGEKEKENTKRCSPYKDSRGNPIPQGGHTKTDAQAILSGPEKSQKKKSRTSLDFNSNEQDKENVGIHMSKDKNSCKAMAPKKSSKKGARVSLQGTAVPDVRRCFAVGGSSDRRNSLHYLIKLLGAKVCRSRYEWKDDITHVVLPAPLRRTEKFLAGAAAGSWILKAEYVEVSRNAGKFVEEEEYEWFGEGTNDKGTIGLQAPRHWRSQFAITGCGAFYGLRVLLYGESFSPPSGTLKRAIRAGGGFVLAAVPPYSQHLTDGVDFAVINPVLVQKADEHVQEFLKHKVACVAPDYFVDYICHPYSSLEKHILYKTKSAVAAAHQRLQNNIARGPTEVVEKLRRAVAQNLSKGHPKIDKVTDDTACVVCRRTDDEKVMLLCGDDKGRGCGLATHIHCCSPPLAEVPDEDWFCRNCEEL